MTEIKKAFYDLMVPLAKKAQAKYGIPPELVVAQAAIESKWGVKAIGNNFFGIKKASRHNQSQTVLTTEQEKTGNIYKARLDFADYVSIEAGVMDYAWLITNGSPYKLAWAAYKVDKDLSKLATGVAKVYATGFSYGQLLRTILGQSDLIEAVNVTG